MPLVELCRHCRWAEAQESILVRPSLMWEARDHNGYTAAYWTVQNENLKMLNFMLEVIECHPEDQQRQMLMDTFETGSLYGRAPIHAACVYGRKSSFDFLIRHCPNGAAILNARDDENDWTPAHFAARWYPEMLNLITEVAENGSEALNVEDRRGRTPLDILMRRNERRMNALGHY